MFGETSLRVFLKSSGHGSADARVGMDAEAEAHPTGLIASDDIPV
jgi:hypothetical protein